MKVTWPVRPPVTCDVLAVKNESSGHCWVLVYCPPDVNAADTRELYDALVGLLLLLYRTITIFGDLNFSEITWLTDAVGAAAIKGK